MIDDDPYPYDLPPGPDPGLWGGIKSAAFIMAALPFFGLLALAPFVPWY